jgi:tripartite-type tricarboxylate transporter receptor subunit TctC
MSFSCTTIGTSMPSVKSGRLSYVAVTSKNRDPLLPQVPTIKEAFGVEITTRQPWVAMYTGSLVPQDRVEFISSTIQDILQTATMSDAIKNVYGHPFIISKSNFVKLYQDDYAKTKILLEKHKISID